MVVLDVPLAQRLRKPGLQTKGMVVVSCLSAAAYFAAAYWLQVAFDPPKSGEKLPLERPFRAFMNSEFAVIATDTMFTRSADSADNNARSDVDLYEDGKLLGPAHGVHADIGNLGQGRFSHWRLNYSIFLFSSSDNTDPRTNGRNYWAVKRPAH
jgi:hypothetical protein